MDTGKAQYYAGGWRDIGNTTGGKVSIELLPLTYPFSMDYAFARQEKSQNVGTTPTVTFQTTNVTVELKNSAGCPDLDTGTAQYYAGGWRNIGDTVGRPGEHRAAAADLPLQHGLRLRPPGEVAECRDDSDGHLPDHKGDGGVEGQRRRLIWTRARHSTMRAAGATSATRSGGQVSIELLPLTYPFSMDYAFARQEKSQNVGTTPTVTFQTTKVTVELKDSTGAYLDTGKAQYYSGGWRNIGQHVGGQGEHRAAAADLPLQHGLRLRPPGEVAERGHERRRSPSRRGRCTPTVPPVRTTMLVAGVRSPRTWSCFRVRIRSNSVVVSLRRRTPSLVLRLTTSTRNVAFVVVGSLQLRDLTI